MKNMYYTVRNEMRAEDIRRVLTNFIFWMPKPYRKRTTNKVVVRDIILNGIGQVSTISCYEICRQIGCDPDAYSFPLWTAEELGAKIEVADD